MWATAVPGSLIRTDRTSPVAALQPPPRVTHPVRVQVIPPPLRRLHGQHVLAAVRKVRRRELPLHPLHPHAVPAGPPPPAASAVPEDPDLGLCRRRPVGADGQAQL
ncbi:hypothetical protein SEVIR_6G203901v4 [Setaria viridis]